MKEILYLTELCQLPPNKHWGELKNAAKGLCVDTMGRHPPSQIGASGCHGGGGYQLLQLNTKGQVALPATFLCRNTFVNCSCRTVSGALRRRARSG